MRYLLLIFIMTSTSMFSQAAAYKQLRPIQNDAGRNAQYWAKKSTDERIAATLHRLKMDIIRNGELLESYEDYEMNSSLLELVDIYYYNEALYVIAWIDGYSYVYCNLSKEAVLGFDENLMGSYGSSFNTYIKPYSCIK